MRGQPNGPSLALELDFWSETLPILKGGCVRPLEKDEVVEGRLVKGCEAGNDPGGAVA
jgi:hypothetical protein